MRRQARRRQELFMKISFLVELMRLNFDEMG
jgi:hypothetical protein